jgi:hypothetical protein
MDNRNVRSDAAGKSQSETERWKSDSETVERYDETAGGKGESRDRKQEEEPGHTPRRYEQPIEADE